MSLITFVVYSAGTGRILRSGLCNFSDLEIQASNTMAPDEVALQTGLQTDPNSNYVTGTAPSQSVATRPAFAGSLSKTSMSANGTDSVTLSGLPNATTITLQGPHGTTTYSVTDGSFVMTTTWPGTYTITATPPFPMLPAKLTVNAS